jgi:hypothetical protein
MNIAKRTWKSMAKRNGRKKFFYGVFGMYKYSSFNFPLKEHLVANDSEKFCH